MIQQSSISSNLKLLIDPHKVDKYLPKLLNGDLHRLESWLPNLLSTGGVIEREQMDYRTSQFRKKDPINYDTNLTLVLRKIEQMKQDKQEVLLALAVLKQATNTHHEKTRKPLF